VPRTDLFNEKEQCRAIIENIKQNFPLLRDDKVNILLAPTYRASGSQVESTFDIVSIVIKIASLLDTNKRIIFKPHPYIKAEEVRDLKKCTNVLLGDNHSINEWMLLSDAFITDYSSAVFEFSLLKRPIAHFIPDIEEYRHNRGFYQDLSVVSDGAELISGGQLVKWINSRYTNETFDTSRMVQYNFDNINDVTKKVVDHLINH